MMRVMLYAAAQSMLHSRNGPGSAWAMQIAGAAGIKKAIVALARRLAVIMHRIWVDGTEFRWTRRTGHSSSMKTVLRLIQSEEARIPPSGGMVSLAGRWMR